MDTYTVRVLASLLGSNSEQRLYDRSTTTVLASVELLVLIFSLFAFTPTFGLDGDRGGWIHHLQPIQLLLNSCC